MNSNLPSTDYFNQMNERCTRGRKWCHKWTTCCWWGRCTHWVILWWYSDDTRIIHKTIFMPWLEAILIVNISLGIDLIMLCSSWDHPHRPGRPSMSITYRLLFSVGETCNLEEIDVTYSFNKILCCGARNWESQKGEFFNGKPCQWSLHQIPVSTVPVPSNVPPELCKSR